ncbi:MAG: T9SS type A sorting domain-containing protein [Ignavibacteriae bacterium]|nr:T9SS type A sorting domain-containing protein [Ignavibacteriota bacterium]
MIRKFIGAAFLLAFLATAAQAQVAYKLTITIGTGTTTQNLELGINDGGASYPASSNGVDTAAAFGANGSVGTAGFRESLAPPAPPAPFDLDAKFLSMPGSPSTFPAGLGAGTFRNFRAFVNSSTVDTFRIKISGDGGSWENNGGTISWPSGLNAYGSSWTIQPRTGTAFAATNMLTSTSVTVPAGNNPVEVYIIKVGQIAPSPGPTFSASPNPLAFGSRNVNTTTDLVLTVSNPGTVNALNVTAVDTTLGGQSFFWVGTAPNPAGFNVPASSSVNFTIRFQPTSGGGFSEQIEFAHNASGSPSVINISGTGQAQGGELVFSADTVVRNDLTSGYVDSLTVATYVGVPTRSLQLRLINTYSPTSKTRLTAVSRGARVADPSKWIFQYEIGHGPVASDLSSIDTIRLVILGTNDSLVAGTSTESLVKFTYSTVDIGTDSAWSSMVLTDIVSSDWRGVSTQLTGDAPQQVLILDRGVGLNGDTNGDGFVDLLDLLQVIDHILGRITLQTREFQRSDVAPWPSGDNALDARDVALIQQIILTGEYPDGSPIPFTGGSVRAISKTGAARLVVDLTQNPAVVSIESNDAVKGVQFDIAGAASNGSAVSDMQNVLFRQNGGTLRSVFYQNSGSELGAGAHVIATLPLVQIAEIEVRNVVVANAMNQRIPAEVLVRKSGTDVPASFDLLGNYPNPFNPSTTISFAVPAQSSVRISVLDMLGREVRTLVSSTVDAGTHSIVWDGLDNHGAAVSSGMFMYRMQAGDFTATRTMTLHK